MDRSSDAIKSLDQVGPAIPVRQHRPTLKFLKDEALSRKLEVARSTVHNWRRDDLVIALPKGVRNHVYPLRQFVGSKPVAGIAPVIEAIGGAEEAWKWLVTPNAHTSGKQPIELLRRGQVDAAVSASKSALDFAWRSTPPGFGVAEIPATKIGDRICRPCLYTLQCLR